MPEVTEGLKLRQLHHEDIDAACELCRLSGWNQLPADWTRLLTYEPAGCFAATVDERLVGTVTTTTYGTKLAWIGMMLVDPDFQRQGIGTALMQQAMSFLESRDVLCIKLDASAEGFPLYENLGFHDLWQFHRWHRLGDGTVQTHDASPQPIDCGLLDEEAFGVNRRAWLEQLAGDSVVASQVDGFGMLRSGHLASYLGPVSAVDVGLAETIIGELLTNTSGSVFWDIPSPNQPAMQLADSLGFEPVRTLTRMWIGRQFVGANYDLQFALSDPGTG